MLLFDSHLHFLFKPYTSAFLTPHLVTCAISSSEWLYDDGRSADVNAFLAKHADIKTKAEAIFSRYKELSDRPAAVKVSTYKDNADMHFLFKYLTYSQINKHTYQLFFTMHLIVFFYLFHPRSRWRIFWG